MTIKTTIAAIKALQNGAYSLSVKYDIEFNELQITRKEHGIIQQGTKYFVSLGHTKEEQLAALEDTINTARKMIFL